MAKLKAVRAWRLCELVFRAVDVLESGLDSENERICESSAVQILKIYIGKADIMPQLMGKLSDRV